MSHLIDIDILTVFNDLADVTAFWVINLVLTPMSVRRSAPVHTFNTHVRNRFSVPTLPQDFD